DVRAEDERAQRPHEEARAECRERGHQRSEFALAWEELRADGLGVVAVDHEVVHLEKVSAGDADNRSDLRFAFLSSQHDFLGVTYAVRRGAREQLPRSAQTALR